MGRKRELREFFARGRITLDDVQFTIMAVNQNEAEKKAEAGEWEDYDISGASSIDWRINGDVEENL